MTITKDMLLAETVQKWPETIPVFINFGMGCIFCEVADFETIEEGALAHEIDVDELMKGLNEAIA
ncbi:MAG: DUF1858 domain-containing protein [Eubacteriaceae bacterium]|nr:DUF1858 domain-containing protein [Eubacteriaceae bacterium]MBR5996066.1 DUF1858 domain-containing protein [Eubacteriaceae bacterium]